MAETDQMPACLSDFVIEVVGTKATLKAQSFELWAAKDIPFMLILTAEVPDPLPMERPIEICIRFRRELYQDKLKYGPGNLPEDAVLVTVEPFLIPRELFTSQLTEDECMDFLAWLSSRPKHKVPRHE